MEEGGPGEYPDYSLEKGGRDDGESEPCRRMSRVGGLPDTVDSKLEQPGDCQGKGICAGKEQGAEEIATAVFQQVAFKKKEFVNGAPLEDARRVRNKLRGRWSALQGNVGTAALFGKGEMGQHLVPGSFRITVADRFIDCPVMLE